MGSYYTATLLYYFIVSIIPTQVQLLPLTDFVAFFISVSGHNFFNLLPVYLLHHTPTGRAYLPFISLYAYRQGLFAVYYMPTGRA